MSKITGCRYNDHSKPHDLVGGPPSPKMIAVCDCGVQRWVWTGSEWLNYAVYEERVSHQTVINLSGLDEWAGNPR